MDSYEIATSTEQEEKKINCIYHDFNKLNQFNLFNDIQILRVYLSLYVCLSVSRSLSLIQDSLILINSSTD